MKAEGAEYKGVLYCGLMMTARGPMVLEFNCRFGDPETQPIVMRMESDLAEALEVRFLANRDRNLHFGLLTDFPDADQEMLPQDGPLLELARRSIEELQRAADPLERRHRLRVGAVGRSAVRPHAERARDVDRVAHPDRAGVADPQATLEQRG